MENLKIKKLDDRAVIPTYGTIDSAGADLYAILDNEVEIKPGETMVINTGLAMAIPRGYVGLIYARSSLGTKKDFSVLARFCSSSEFLLLNLFIISGISFSFTGCL